MSGLLIRSVPTWLAEAVAMLPSPTVTIDTDSDPGAWEEAIANTPHLHAQIDDESFDPTPTQDPNVND